MPRVYLYCRESDRIALENVKPILLEWLGKATADSLQLEESNGVDLLIIAASMQNSHRVEIVATVSKDATPKQDLGDWGKQLRIAI